MTEEDLGIRAPIRFDVNDAAIAEVKEQFKDVDAYKDIEEAKAAKKVLTKMRTALAEAHKEAKAEALEYGRRCDAEKNRLLAQIKEIEDPISDQLDEIKMAEQRREEERLAKIQGHIERLEAYSSDRYSLTLEELEERQANLAAEKITEERYQEQTERATLTKQESEMRLRIAIGAEKTRLEDEAKAAAQEEENRLLREKLEKLEREQAEKDAAEAAERAEKERKEREAAEARAAEERAAREKLEAENRKLREEQERKEQEEREAAAKAEAEARAAAQAPDREKLKAYAGKVDALIKDKPALDTEEAQLVMLNTLAALAEVVQYLRKETEEID